MSYPYKSGYIGQLHADGWGWDDCAEASAVRLVREAGKMDPTGDPLAQIARMRYDMTGEQDSPYNGYTYSDQIIAGLAKYSIGAHWSDRYQEAHDCQWSLVVINYVVMLAGGGYAYPESALGGGTHVCLWMPDGLANDPLAQLGGYGDVRWDYGSLQQQFLGAIIIDTAIGPAWPPAPAPSPKPVRKTATHALGVKPTPARGGPNLVVIPSGGQYLDTQRHQNGLTNVFYSAHGHGYWGWVGP